MLLFICGAKGKGKTITMFQYISCYSLSLRTMKKELQAEGFNTSHVTLYLLLYSSLNRFLQRFNTSHVTLYLYLTFKFPPFLRVSIHLMLLFILFWPIGLYLLLCFNTSHVTLYLIRTSQKPTLILRFNTSHVTLYQLWLGSKRA